MPIDDFASSNPKNGDAFTILDSVKASLSQFVCSIDVTTNGQVEGVTGAGAISLEITTF